ncbi:hypothetical protein [Klebsiella pneumoniae ISC21]|nr:hypothetical protein [Klebsiella pneumoniae ISC21]
MLFILQYMNNDIFISFLVILHYYGFTLFGKLIGSQLNKVCLYTIININI